MQLITIDFETYYDKQFSLSKITTEEYVRSPMFEVIGVGIKVNDGETEWYSGDNTQEFIDRYDWGNSLVLAHNTMFDGAILGWRFGVKPKGWLDTMCMSRAIYGTEVSHSLDNLTKRLGVGKKGDEVLNALGKRRADFTPEEMRRYGQYCINDVELTYEAFNMLCRGFPKTELKLIDLTLSMFTHPILELDKIELEEHLTEVAERKRRLLEEAGVTDKKDLMSNNKFADMLRDLDVDPPTKISLTTGKKTYAFAKNDEKFKELEEHFDDRVQSLVAARLGNKSTLEESRTERFIGIAERGNLPVPLRYYAAHTGRWGGADKINLQNLPSRGPNGKALKKCIIAPEGYMVVEADSSQIEARVLAWLSEQNDLVQAFLNKEDVYKIMASSIYNKPVDEITKEERFVGKTTILGAGYGMGAGRFREQLKGMGVELDLMECKRIIDIYRGTYPMIPRLWRLCGGALELIYKKGPEAGLGCNELLTVDSQEQGIKLPNGLYIRYTDLRAQDGERGGQYHYKVRSGRNRIYGGKVVENVCQALARSIIGEQMLLIAKRYKVAFTVHDSVGIVVREEEVEEAKAYVEDCMRWVPSWAEGMPIDCEAGYAKSYGDCE